MEAGQGETDTYFNFLDQDPGMLLQRVPRRNGHFRAIGALVDLDDL